jgi:hypothetical protein
MPAQILHTLFGEDVMAGICRRLHPGLGAEGIREKIREDYPDVFALGCQGPDIFYHSQMSRPVALEYGTLLHRRGCGDFSAALLAMTLPGPRRGEAAPGALDALGVYALGFMTHAILDRACHPYIICKSGGGQSHAFFERIIDTLMLEYLRGEPVCRWDQGGLLGAPCGDPPRGLKELLARALGAVFPERAGRDALLARRMDNAFRDCAGFYRFTDPRKTGGRAGWGSRALVRELPLPYLYPEKLPLGIDYLNLSRRTWVHPAPGGRAGTRSFPEIYAAAVEEGSALLAGLMGPYLAAGIFSAREAGEVLGNGGLSLRDEAGKPCAPVRTEPLPLEAVLDQQRRIRRRRDPSYNSFL